MGIILTSTGLPLLTSTGLTASRTAPAGGGGSVPPPEPQPGVLAFGALTLAGAGGVAKPAGATRITGGTATGYTIVSGFVVPSSHGSADSGTIIFDDATTWTVSAMASEYSVRTVAEMEAVNALGTATLGGKTMRIRPGTYVVNNSAWLANRTFATRFTVASHDEPAFPGIGSASHDRVKIITVRDGVSCFFGGMSRVTFNGVGIEGQFDRNNPSAKYVMNISGATVTDIVFENCWLKGDNDVIGASATFEGFLSVASERNPGYVGSIGVAFRHSRLSHFYRNHLARHGRREITNCQIDNYVLDAAIGGWEGDFVFTDNFLWGPNGDKSYVQWKTAKASIDAPVKGVSDSMQGIFHARISRGGDSGTRQVWASLQALGGIAYAQIERTPDFKVRFWAADAGGTVRVDLKSAMTLKSTYQYHVLVSVDNRLGGVNKMFVWERAAKQTADPLTEQVEQPGTGHALHWNAGGLSVGADNSAAGGGNHWGAYAGRFLFHPGISPDVFDPAVQAVFFEPDSKAGHEVHDHATFGQPPIDYRPNLTELRLSADRGTAYNHGSAQGLVLRTDRRSVETGHQDGIQFITNGGDNPGSGGVDGGPIWIERNVMFAHRLNGDFEPSGGQGFFFEDIQEEWVYDRPIVRNNLMVVAGPNIIAVSNPHLAKAMHNTIITTAEMTDNNSHFGKIAFGLNYRAPLGTLRNQQLASGFMRSNMSHGHSLSDNIGLYIDSPDTHPTLMDNVDIPTRLTLNGIGPYFAGSNGDGTGFDWAELTSCDAIKAMFATNAGQNPAGVVKRGWDAYWGEESPWDGTCDAFTVLDIGGVGESDFVTPANVSAGGIAVHANGALECRLYGNDNRAISDWTTRPLHLSAGQKFKVRRTSGTGSATIYAGDHTDTWTVS